MEIVIHRGTHQIGGCATEYRTENTRIFVDFGAELDSKNSRTLDIEGVTKGISDCGAVFFTHYHGDHMGLLDTINPDIPLYMGEAAKTVAQIFNNRMSRCPNVKAYDAGRIEMINVFKAECPISVGDIRITPFPVDHSAYDSYMFLIEADGKRLLHTGDFRLHGFGGGDLLPTLEEHAGKVDALVCEGTAMSRPAVKTETEYDLKNRIKTVLSDNKHVFVVCSSTNIDRIAGICSVVPRGKYCLCDRYQLSVIDYIRQTAGKEEPLYSFGKALYYDKNLDEKMLAKGFCMFVRAGNPEHKKVMDRYKHLDPVVIYSMWKGYLEREDVKTFLEGFRRVDMHTSGHADKAAVKALIDAVDPAMVIPMHTEAPEMFLDISEKNRVVLTEDGDLIKL